MILLALDLDNTLIHSYKRAAENDVCVETMETENGIKKLSFMSPDAYRKFTSLSSEIIAVPITTKSENVPETMKMLSESLDMNIVTLHENGSKVYILPKGLDKGSCLERLKKKLSPDITIAAGDSRFDIPMLAAADVPIIPHDFPSGSVNSDALTVCPYAQTGKFAEFILDFAENFYLKYRKNP